MNEIILLLIVTISNIYNASLNIVNNETAVPEPAITNNDFEEELYHLHNKVRIEKGLQPFNRSGFLEASARDKGNIMLRDNCWSPYCPDAPWGLFIIQSLMILDFILLEETSRVKVMYWL